MTGFLLSPAAQADLEAIWDYTAVTWGIDKAEAYTQDIRDACFGLVRGTQLSRVVDLRPGYRKAPVGSHLLFYRRDEADQIVIVRILHCRMDEERHL